MHFAVTPLPSTLSPLHLSLQRHPRRVHSPYVNDLVTDSLFPSLPDIVIPLVCISIPVNEAESQAIQELEYSPEFGEEIVRLRHVFAWWEENGKTFE